MAGTVGTGRSRQATANVLWCRNVN